MSGTPSSVSVGTSCKPGRRFGPVTPRARDLAPGIVPSICTNPGMKRETVRGRSVSRRYQLSPHAHLGHECIARDAAHHGEAVQVHGSAQDVLLPLW
jgi:hypothetical protein